MPRRRAVTREQLEVLLALPATETELIRHWTLGAADLAAIERRRGDPNQLGFALQLCAFRDELEPTLTRNGYDAPALTALLNAKPAEVRDFLVGTLAADRTREFTEQLRIAGVPV